MDTQPNPIQSPISQPPISPQISLDPTPQPKKALTFPIIVILLILVLLSAVGYFYLQTRSLRSQLSASPTPTSSSIAEPSIDSTSNWKTYTDSEHGFTFKHPSELVFENNEIKTPHNNEIGIQAAETQEKTLANYLSKNDKTTFENSSTVQVQSSKAIVINNYDAITREEYLSFADITIIKTYFINNGVIISISLESPPGNTKVEDRKLYDQILSTFQFIDPSKMDTTEYNGWETYENTVRKYSIKYPDGWVLDKSKAEVPISETDSASLTISKGKYKLTILWPAAFGPGICLFDDQSRTGAPEMASYCEGKYVEYRGDNSIFRRLVQPEKFDDYVQWEVYTKDKNNYFITLPPIRIVAPLNYQLQEINIMDKIIQSYNQLN